MQSDSIPSSELQSQIDSILARMTAASVDDGNFRIELGKWKH